MKKLISLLALLLLMTGCGTTNNSSSTEQTVGYQTITPAQAYEMMQQQTVIIVDVRTATEYEPQHIPNAILIPHEEIGAETEKILPDKQVVILVYCRSGRRSQQASQKLADLGYQHIYDFGGIIDWPYETVN